TPQVWKDPLALEQHRQVRLQLDNNHAQLPPALVQTMFEANIHFIKQHNKNTQPNPHNHNDPRF
ncbi:hypothetical protein ACNIU4_26885, partial [Escherichia coli]